MMERLDIMRTSASRPEMLKVTTESLAKYLKFSGEIRVVVHEDVLHRKASDECIKYLNYQSPWPPPSQMKEDDPPVTQLMSMTWLLDQMTTKYFLNWEDDHEAVREVDLDLACKILDENDDVNQIAFQKRQTMHFRPPSFFKIEVGRSGSLLTTNPHWAFTPAIWRKSFVMQYWKPPYTHCDNNPVWWLNPRIKRSGSMRGPKWIIKNSGHYFMGGIGEHAFCRHIGGGKSLRTGDYIFKE